MAAFHRRPLANRSQALMLDVMVLPCKTGAGFLLRPFLVASGLRRDGKKEVVNFRLAASESAAEWERSLSDLYRCGLTGEGLDMICVDDAAGPLLARVRLGRLGAWSGRRSQRYGLARGTPTAWAA